MRLEIVLIDQPTSQHSTSTLFVRSDRSSSGLRGFRTVVLQWTWNFIPSALARLPPPLTAKIKTNLFHVYSRKMASTYFSSCRCTSFDRSSCVPKDDVILHAHLGNLVFCLENFSRSVTSNMAAGWCFRLSVKIR